MDASEHRSEIALRLAEQPPVEATAEAVPLSLKTESFMPTLKVPNVPRRGWRQRSNPLCSIRVRMRIRRYHVVVSIGAPVLRILAPVDRTSGNRSSPKFVASSNA